MTLSITYMTIKNIHTSLLDCTFDITISVLHEGVPNGPLRLVQREVIVTKMGALVKRTQVQNIQIGSLQITNHKSHIR